MNLERTMRVRIPWLGGLACILTVLLIHSVSRERGEEEGQSLNLPAGQTRDCLTWEPMLPLRSEAYGYSSDMETMKNVKETTIHRKKSFIKIWEHNLWSLDSKSGSGSILRNTVSIRNILGSLVTRIKNILKKDSISLLDSSCGSMEWMATFLQNRTDIMFTGYDIVPASIESHLTAFAEKPWHFQVKDIARIQSLSRT